MVLFASIDTGKLFGSCSDGDLDTLTCWFSQVASLREWVRVRLRTGASWKVQRVLHRGIPLVAWVVTLCVKMEDCDMLNIVAMQLLEVRHFRK